MIADYYMKYQILLCSDVLDFTISVGNRNSLLPIEDTVIFSWNQSPKLTPMGRFSTAPFIIIIATDD